MNSLHSMKLDLRSVLISVSSGSWLGIKMWTFYKENSSIFRVAGDARPVVLIPAHLPNPVTTRTLFPVLLSAIPAGNIPLCVWCCSWDQTGGIHPKEAFVLHNRWPVQKVWGGLWHQKVTQRCQLQVSLKRHPGVQLPSARDTGILFHGGMEKKPQENLWEDISQSLPRPDGCIRTMFQGAFFVPKGTSARVASHKLEEASRFCVWLFFFQLLQKKRSFAA